MTTGVPPHPRALRALSTVMAVILPVVVLVAGLSLVEAHRDYADEREIRNAGRVMNGTVLQRDVVSTIEHRLTAEPDIILLGNSLSNTDLLPTLLTRRLGLPPKQFQKFSIPNSIGAHWYVILKNRVYANNHRPRFVLILSDMQSALATTPRTEPSYVNLTVQYAEQEPVVEQKLGKSNYLWDRVRENREALRESFLKRARNLVVDLFWYRSLATDHGKTNAALERAFDQSRTDVSLHNNVIPIMSASRELQPFDPSLLPKPKDSFLPEITEMVTQNEGTILYLRPPMSPLLPDEIGDLVLPGVEEKTRKLVEGKGGYYLDFRSLDMDPGHFYNVDHMNPEGARRFTETVALVMKEIVKQQQRGRRLEPHEIDLLTPVELVDGAIRHRTFDADLSRRPPEVPGSKRPFAMKRWNIGFYQADGLGFFADTETIERTALADRCSPLRVLEDGVALPHHNVTCEELHKLGAGRVCHAKDKIFFTASDDTAPDENGRTYTLALDPARSCEGAVWLYPGDTARFTFPDEEVALFSTGGRSLVLEGHDLGGAGQPAALQVRLRANGQVRLEDTFNPTRDGTSAALRVSPPIPKHARDVQLAVTNPTDRFVLLTGVRLSERSSGSLAEVEAEP